MTQIGVSPFRQQRDARRTCAVHGIPVGAYSPLTEGRRLGDPTVDAVARRHGRSPAQVLIRWALQHDLVVLPKSVRRDRIVENADVFDFELEGRDMDLLDTLEEGLFTGWDPSTAP